MLLRARGLANRFGPVSTGVVAGIGAFVLRR